MDIKGPNCRVYYDSANAVVNFEGILRLGGPQEYQPIEDLLERVLHSDPKVVALDLRALNFLNSSGINVLYKFAIATRKEGELQGPALKNSSMRRGRRRTKGRYT